MKLVWADNSWNEYIDWQESDRDMVRKINDLIKDIGRTPFKGLGKPEPLKGVLSGWWSRRITGEHRLVYRIAGKSGAQAIEIAQCKGHY